jgi:hypothetical protein
MMVIRRFLLAMAATLTVFGLLSASGGAWNGGPDYLTFNRPVALPGVVLPAGTYMFAQPSWSDRSIVQVLSRDSRHVYFQAYTRPVDRPDSLPKDRVVTFREAPPGVPTPIAAWYPIDSSPGHEFIYR